MAMCFLPSIYKKKTNNAKFFSRDEEEDGVSKVKIVVTKRELKHLIAAMNQREQDKYAKRRYKNASPTFEQLFSVLRWRRAKKEEPVNGRYGGWQPALQSIPEEY